MSEITVRRAGIDTFSACWKLAGGSRGARALDALATQPASRGRLVPEKIGGFRVGWFPGPGLAYVEGHPGGEDGLGGASGLAEALRAVKAQLSDIGVQLPDARSHRGSPALGQSDRDGFAGVRRVDACVDLDVQDRSAGLALLAAVAATSTVTPRTQSSVRFASDGTGAVETVAFHGLGGKKILARWYDKGVESVGPGQRGVLIRAEDQRRYPSGRRPPVEAVTGAQLRTNLRQRFYPMWQATKGTKVLTQVRLIRELGRKVDAGELRPTSAEKLAGYLVLARKRWPSTPAEERRDRRRREQFRRLGLIETPAALEDVEFDLHEVLEQVLDGAVWGDG